LSFEGSHVTLQEEQRHIPFSRHHLSCGDGIRVKFSELCCATTLVMRQSTSWKPQWLQQSQN